LYILSDIPHSDEESDDGTAATVLEISLPPPSAPEINGNINAAAKAIPAQHKDMADDPDYMDYDMEGEDDDAEGEDDEGM
jgi:hypothetical protein